MLISNHNSFRVLFDKIASVYFIWKKYLFSISNGQPREPVLCQLYRHTFIACDCLVLQVPLECRHTAIGVALLMEMARQVCVHHRAPFRRLTVSWNLSLWTSALQLGLGYRVIDHGFGLG